MMLTIPSLLGMLTVNCVKVLLEQTQCMQTNNIRHLTNDFTAVGLFTIFLNYKKLILTILLKKNV